MLSAVENLGSGRVYPHPFPGAAAPSLLGQLPLSAAGLPLLGPNMVDMSVAEFARPHPKQQRYNEAPRNGLLPSSRPKYSDVSPQSPQSGPVNLAVSPNLPNPHSNQTLGATKLGHLGHDFHERALQAHAAQARAHAQQQQQQQQQQHQQHQQQLQQQQQRHQEQQKEAAVAAAAAAAAVDIGKLYSPTNPRLSFFPGPIDNSYPSLNYGLYPFGYSAAHIEARLLGRPPYIPGQREPYPTSPFLTPGSFGTPDSSKSKNYAPVSLPHVNGHIGLKPTSLPQLPQDKIPSSERSPTLPPSPSSSGLMGSAYSDRDRGYPPSGMPSGIPEHSLHSSKYPSNHPILHEKENKLEHKQHNSSHHQPQLSNPASLSRSPLQTHHPFLPPMPSSSSTASSQPSSTSQRHHSMPHSSSSALSHHPHPSLAADGGLRLEQLPQDNEFKVPSGKEGSMKHRILTRPASERDVRRRSPTTKSTTIFRPYENGTTTNFTKGALIQLAEECKRVEDVRTEDLVQTAEKSANLRLAESTAVKITPRNNNVIITFSYDNNRSRIDIEATIEHPFFVYGQGWASCSPEKSLHHFGLKCQKLQVGDICLSLIPREKPKTSHSSSSSSSTSYLAPQPASSGGGGGGGGVVGGQYLLPSQQLHHHDINGNQTSLHHQPPYHLQQHTQQSLGHSPRANRDRGEIGGQYLPQNLSRKAPSFHSSTIPTTATTTAVSSRPSGTLPYSSFPSVPAFSMPFSAANLSKPHDPSHYSPKRSPDHLTLGNRSGTKSQGSLDSADQPVAMVVDKPTHSSSSSTSSTSSGVSSGASYTSSSSAVSNVSSGGGGTKTAGNTAASVTDSGNVNMDDEDCVIDASVSRKRRWSAPDVCDDPEDASQDPKADGSDGQPPPAKVSQPLT